MLFPTYDDCIDAIRTLCSQEVWSVYFEHVCLLNQFEITTACMEVV